MNTNNKEKNKLFKYSDFSDFTGNVLKSPVTKVILIGAGVLVLIWVSGYIFKIINFSVGNFKELKNTCLSK